MEPQSIDYLLVSIVLQDELFQEEERPLVIDLAVAANIRRAQGQQGTVSRAFHSPFAGAVQPIATYL